MARPAPLLLGSLTTEISDPASPVRRFLDDRFTPGLRAVQRNYRADPPGMAVHPAAAGAANPGTTGTAADWLLRFLLHPRPDLHLPLAGVVEAARAGISTLAAFSQIADSLGFPQAVLAGDLRALPGTGPGRPGARYTGPVPGSTAGPGGLARACWALALLTEAFRGGPAVAAAGPLGQYRGRPVSAGDLLALTPPAAITQLAGFRHVYETTLIPQLAARPGLWALGPAFAGSELMNADADLIAGGLLIDLKTSAGKPSLPLADLYQVIGYALLDFDDEYRIDSVGIFSARYARLTRWPLDSLLRELAGHEISLTRTRRSFRQLLAPL